MDKSIKYNRDTKDFEVTVNGEVIGYTATFLAGEAMADKFVHAALIAAPPAEEATSGPVVINPANITRQTVAAVLVEARAKVADNRRWATALAKAATELEATPWYFTGAILVIGSRTTPGKKYRVDGQHCECAAHAKNNPCWHRAAARLLIRAAQVAA